MNRLPTGVMALLLALLLVIAACTAGTTEPDPPEEDGVGQTKPSEPLTPGGEASGDDHSDPAPRDVVEVLEQIPDAPLVSRLEVKPAVVGPGQSVAIGADPRLSGPLVVRGETGVAAEGALTRGSAVVALTGDVEPGVYTVELDGDSGAYAVGVLRVARGPGLWLSTSRRFVRTGAPAELAVEWVGFSGDERAVIAVEDDEGGLFGWFVPGPDGVLVPIRLDEGVSPADQGATLESFLNRPLALPDFVAGRVRLELLSGAESEATVASNSLRLERCDEGGFVSGDLEGPGTVHASWLDGGLRSTALFTDDGSYRLAAGPGRVMVTTTRLLEDGTSVTETTVVEVRCGAAGVVGVDDVPAAASDVPPDLEPGAYVAAASGSADFQHEGGVADCSLSGEELTVTMIDDVADPEFTITLLADGFHVAGELDANVFLFDSSFTYSDGWVTLDLTQEESGPITGVFAGTVEGELGAVDLEGAFRCWTDGPGALGTPGYGTVLTVGGTGVAGGVTAGFVAQTGRGGDQDKCRRGLIDVSGESRLLQAYEATALERATADLPLVDWNSRSGLKRLLEQEALRQLMGSEESLTPAVHEAVNADFLIELIVIKEEGATRTRVFGEDTQETRYWLVIKAYDLDRGSVVTATTASAWDEEELAKQLPRFNRILRALRSAAICGEVEPEAEALDAGQSTTLNFRVRTLDGEEVSGARVTVADRLDDEFSPDCGSFNQTEGTTSSPFTTEFTAADEPPESCSEYPRFTATWNGPAGTVETDPEREKSDARLDVESEWDFTLTAELDTGEGLMNWVLSEGSFVVRDDGFIVGEAVGRLTGEGTCREFENGVLVHEQATEISGSWQSQVHGRSTGAGDEAEIRLLFLGFGWSFAWDPRPARCELLLLNDTAEGIMRFIAFQPDNTVPGGIVIEPVLGKKWIFIMGEGLSGTVTVQLEQRES